MSNATSGEVAAGTATARARRACWFEASCACCMGRSVDTPDTEAQPGHERGMGV